MLKIISKINKNADKSALYNELATAINTNPQQVKDALDSLIEDAFTQSFLTESKTDIVIAGTPCSVYLNTLQAVVVQIDF